MTADANFWENAAYFLGGVVVSGLLAAVAQLISLRTLAQQHTKVKIIPYDRSDK